MAIENFNSELDELGRFFIQAAKDIVTPRGSKIIPGDNILIDPGKPPSEGDMVLVGNSLIPWLSQSGISGVAVSVCRDV